MSTRAYEPIHSEEDSPGEPDTIWVPEDDDAEGAEAEGEPDEEWPGEPDDA